MTKKLAVILLDALGPDNIYRFDGFDFIMEKYKENGDVLGISTIPHTAASNPMIWGGVENQDKFWIHSRQWVDPAMFFNRDTGDIYHEKTEHGQPVPDETRRYVREDYEDTFIWDDLDAAGLDATALQVPIVLPPYSYNADDVLEGSWFPDTAERMDAHVEEKSALIANHAASEYDLICSSIQMPDKWVHGIAEGKCSREFVTQQSFKLDRAIQELVRTFEQYDYDWVFAGDHGNPCPGAMVMRKAREVLPRHAKESVIFSNLDEFPTYTDEFYPFMLDYFDVEESEYEQIEEMEDIQVGGDVENRLKALGYR